MSWNRKQARKVEYVIATSVNSGFDHECESLIKKINFYLCGKYSEISLKIEAGENVGEKITKVASPSFM